MKWTEYAYHQLTMDVLAEFPQTGPPRVNYLYRGRAGAIVAMEEQQGGGPGKEYWFAQDGLGSVAAVTKHSGQSAHEYFYTPFGGIVDDNGHPEDSSNWTDPHNHYLLTGKEWDEESRLYYFGARYYDAATGVWLTQDVYRGQVEQPLTLHRTLYVLANPVNNVDPYGYAVIANGYGGSGGGSTPVSPQQPAPPNPTRPDNHPYEWVDEPAGGGGGGGKRDEPEDKIGALSLLAQPCVLEPWAYELQQPQIQASSVLDVDDYVELPGEVVADWAGHRILNTGLGLTEGVVNWAQDPVRETRFGILVGPNLNDWREAYAEGSRMWEAARTGDAEHEWGWSAYRLYLDVTGMRDPVVGLASHVAEAGYAGGRLRDSDLSNYERTWAFLDVAAFGFEVGSTVAGGYSLVRGAGVAAGAAASPLDEMAGAMAANPLDEMAEGYAAIPANRALVPYDPEFAAWQAAHSGDVGRAAYLLYNSGAEIAGAEYMLKALNGEYDDILRQVDCHGAALGRTEAVGGAWMGEEGGSLVADPSFKFEAKFPIQELGENAGNLQPGDLLTYHSSSGNIYHSNRFIGVTESGPAFFDKPGPRFDYTLFTLEEMASEMAASPIEFQTVRVYRSAATLAP